MSNEKNKIEYTLQECKEYWSSSYKKTWDDVKNDFEYGLGLSKIYSFEQITDMVAEIYKNQLL